MVEKKLLVDGLRFSYNGPFDITEFYNTVEDWIREKGLEKELKRKLEHVTPTGKKIEWFIECWKKVTDYAKPIIRMRALFNNVQEIEIVKGGERRRLNSGDVLIIFDGFLETQLEGRWQQKPGFYFLRAMVDKYIYKFWTERHDSYVREETRNMYEKLKEFFELYR